MLRVVGGLFPNE